MKKKARNDFLGNRVIPVAVFDSVPGACRTVELLLKHSFKTVEVTLRTEKAFACIEEISKKFPEIITGAGSVLEVDSLKKAVDCGAQYSVSPVLDSELIEYSVQNDIFFVPGISTPSELSSALKLTDVVKVFPASQLGGIGYLKAICAPFCSKEFYLVPTGGINRDNFMDYLDCSRVSSCGMSYLVDSSLIKSKMFKDLEDRIKYIASRINFPLEV